MTVGEKIRNMRQIKGLTQKELGEKCGIADSAIRRYELGGANPKMETLQKIADAMEIPISMLRSDLELDLEHLTQEIHSWSSSVIIEGMTETQLIDSFRKLNDTGKNKAIEQVELLTKIPEFQKTCDPDQQ